MAEAFVLESVEPGESLSWASRLLSGEPQDAFAPSEAADFAVLKTDKRRRDWTGGRLAAKRAASKAIGNLPLGSILIENEPGGAPRMSAPGAQLPLSITHTDAGAACAVSMSGGPIGIDWEMVRPLDAGTLSLAFHEDELPWAMNASPRDLARAWTAKEAVIKLLKSDLSSLREVRLSGPDSTPRLHGAAALKWEELGRPALTVFHANHPGSVLCVAHG